MAKRYSGNLQINVTYSDRNIYRAAVSQDGKLLWRGTVRPAPAGFGPGVAYDSPQAYDEIASSALAFADDEVGGIGDEAEFREDLTGYLIRRIPRARGSSHATRKRSSHATKAPIQAGDCVVMREPHRRFITSTTGGAVFKVVAVSGGALTLEGPLDHHPKHRQQKIMGAHQFKRVPCPHFGDDRDGQGSATTMPRIEVRKIKGRWQPVDVRGLIIRGSVYNADGLGYSTKQGAAEAAEMLRQFSERT